MKLTTAAWIGVAGLIAMVVVLAVQLAGDEVGTVPSPLIGQPGPDLELPYLEEEGALRLADLRGDIVVVNFWASWCLPCRQEHPALVTVSNALADQGVTFVQISYQSDPGDDQAFLDELGRSTHTAYVIDPATRAAIEFGLFGIPETFFIDRDGVIAAKITGPATEQLLLDTVADVEAGRGSVTKTGDVQPAP